MITSKRIVSLLLCTLMILPAAVFPAAAAEDTAGMTFTADKLYSLTKNL